MADYESIVIKSPEKPPPSETAEDKFQTLKTLVVSSAHVMHDTYAGFIAPLLPYLIERLSLLKS